MGLVSGALSLAREPVRLTLRVWEVGLTTAADAARLGRELLDPDRPGGADFEEFRAAAEPGYAGNGDGPQRGGPAEPDVLDLEDAPPPVEDVDAPPNIPDELIPDHVDEEVVLVAETAEEGAEDGAGPELTVEQPWDGYDGMTAADIRDRLATVSVEVIAAVELYESTHKNRRSVMDAAARALKR